MNFMVSEYSNVLRRYTTSSLTTAILSTYWYDEWCWIWVTRRRRLQQQNVIIIIMRIMYDVIQHSSRQSDCMTLYSSKLTDCW